MTESQYNQCKPYKPICAMFAKHGEYVGGADGLLSIYEFEFNTTVNGRCPGCFGAMLLDVNRMILEYEENVLSKT